MSRIERGLEQFAYPAPTLLDQADWQQVQDGLEVRLVEHPDGAPGERYILCRSGARAQKECAMLQRQSDRLTAELVKIDAWLRRSPQSDQEAVGRRIGRHLGRYPAAAAIIRAEVCHDEHRRAVSLQVCGGLEAGQKAHRQKGAYLRTNCEQTDPALLWRWYIQLTQAEAAFCTAKNDLGLRRSSIRRRIACRRTSWYVFWRWRCGARSSNGCARRAWARARSN